MSNVISSVILCAMVLVIGASVWGFTSGASSQMASGYYKDVLVSVENIRERFCIENIGFDNTSPQRLKIWIFNYGKIDMTVDLIFVSGSGNVSGHSIGVSIPAGGIARVDIAPNGVPLVSGSNISVEVSSARGNKAYASTLIP